MHHNISSLSDRRLKQIAGRCRHHLGLLSENIIYNTPEELASEHVSKDSLIEAAKNEIAALECIKRHHEKHPLLKKTVEFVRDMVAEGTRSDGCHLVR